MGIKTLPQPPYCQDFAPFDFWLFPKLTGYRYETIEERGCDEGHWHPHTRGLPWGLAEIVGTVQQVHCSRRRLVRRWLEFLVCTINESVHTKKCGNLFYDPRISTRRRKAMSQYKEMLIIKVLSMKEVQLKLKEESTLKLKTLFFFFLRCNLN